MGLMDWIRPWRSSADSGTMTTYPVLDYLLETTEGKTVDELWKEQPHLRTVVGFLTRNVAQLNLRAVKVAADGSKTPVTSGPLAALLGSRPNDDQTWYEFMEALVGDISLYDNAYIVKFGNEDAASGIELRLIRPIWIQGVAGMGPWGVTKYVVKYPEDNASVDVPAKDVLHLHGYNPMDTRVGVSPVASLKSTLAEQIHASTFRSQLWKRGGRVGSYLTRPADAPAWDETARRKFKRDFGSAWSGDGGSKAGGVPLFEDGMEMKRVGFSAKDEQFVEATKLSLQTVAAVFYVNPTMVGILDNANYSNVREFRRMLYGETLGPLLEMISQRFTGWVLPWLGLKADGKTLVSFDVEGRTAGTFEEQMEVAGSATGAPILTVNEYRARIGYGPIEGGEEMAKPLNNANNGGDPGDIPAATEDDTGDAPPTDDPADPDNEPKTGLEAVTKALEGPHA